MNGRRLYEEIGGVDERYLQQAAGYRVRKKAPVWRAVLIAAALMMACVVLLTAVSAGIAIGVIADALRGEPDAPSYPSQDTQELTPLEQMELTMQTAQADLTQYAADELPLFSGTPKLIWREQGSDAYYSVTLSTYECEQLIGMMQSNRRTEYSEQSEQPQYDVWLSFGDGVVVSPYLKNTAGNTGHGSVFDYDPELEMSDDLAKLIAQYIET